MKIVFMGTPEFAVPCLQRMISDGLDVVGVFTQPDKPKGRGHKVQFSPVKEVAIENNIPVFQPQKMRDGEALSILKELNPDLIIVVAYGKILPEEIINFPKYGCVNIHASVLPKYRGAAPIQWAVLNGEKISGVTAMQMDVGLDTGDILLCKTTEISENDTAGDLHDKLSVLGAQTLSETIKLIENNQLQPVKQDDALSNYSPMLSKELCPVDWSKSAQEVHNQIRGLSPWPVATAHYNGKIYKIHKSALSCKTDKTAGTIIEADKKLIVACGDSNSIEIVTIQAEGKKAMNSSDFLRGNHIEVGEKFER
ncbi:MAG: methionyl-tRNA formyltransferase [Ruminococcus sp.]|nr:methionyl-tRNA formyltransferase [Candidatus Copronaster equi]